MSWYRADNASNVAGYLERPDQCATELPVERFFLTTRCP